MTRLWSVVVRSVALVVLVFAAGSGGNAPAAVPPELLILFQTDRGGTSDIYAMDAFGRRQVPVVATEANEEDPDWGSDGGFAFSSDRDGSWQIYVVDATGGEPRQLTDGRSSSVDPIWSPDGSKIAFETDRTGDWEVFVMDADGSNPVNMSQSKALDLDPNWSADGRRVVFDRILKQTSDLYQVDVRNRRVTRVTITTNRAELEPAYSPRDDRLAYIGFDGRNYDLFVRAEDGRDTLRLTRGAASELDPAWSADAQTIVFTSSVFDSELEIMAIGAGGGRTRNLSRNHEANDSEPDWRPASSRSLSSLTAKAALTQRITSRGPNGRLTHGPLFACGLAATVTWVPWRVVVGNSSENRLCGVSDKNDWLRGFLRWDRLNGRQGVDRFEGGAGGDWFKSHDGERDTLYGGQLTLNASHGIIAHSDPDLTDVAWPDKLLDRFFGINKLNP